jgi:hypothetical protein
MPKFRVYADLKVSLVVEADSEEDARDVFMEDVPYPQCAHDPDSDEEGTVAADLDEITEVELIGDDEEEEDADESVSS